MLREARTCYDHLADRVAVAIADRMVERGHLLLGADGGEVTAEGAGFLAGMGVEVAEAWARRRTFCRPCLDWTERRPHLGGALGAAVYCRCMGLGWIERIRDSRAVRITPAGRSGLAASFDVEA